VAYISPNLYTSFNYIIDLHTCAIVMLTLGEYEYNLIGEHNLI